jgi:GNAT superfamily N-acetyltransferase
MAARIFTIADRPDLEDRLGEVGDPWPEFIHHDVFVNSRWPALYEDFREFQLALLDEETDTVVGKGNTIPIAWDGRVETLTGGVVEALEVEGRPNVLCALVAVVDPARQGQGLSGLVIEGMRGAAAAAGLECLIAPVRPTWKERYPLTPFERYIHWARADGLPFDPWIRLHHRLGAEMLRVAARSLDVRGTVAEWEEWTGMAFPESGDYIVPGALVPVRIDRKRNEGRYVEPNVWMRHAL